jgi:glycosyltransferase involved in cell wall biosynthesis
MRILHVITGLSEGGAEGVLSRLIQNDKTNQHAVVSLTTRGKHGDVIEDCGGSVTALGMQPSIWSLPSCYAFRNLFRKVRPAVVQTWLYHADFAGGTAARLLGSVPVVWGIRHSTLSITRDKIKTILLTRVLAGMSHFVPARIAVCSKRAAQVHASLGYNRSKMRVIPNGYDVNALRSGESLRSAWRASHGIPAQMCLVGMVARYSPQKDHAACVEAFARVKHRWPDAKLVLAGAEMTVSNRALIQQLRDKNLLNCVHLLGSVPEVAGLMHALDIHVLSSSHGEAFPNVVAEAMACGTPCIVTDVGDAAMIVGETGWIVPPRDVDSLAKAIADAIDERTNSKWHYRCKAARERIAENFNITGMVQAYNALWREACGIPSLS